MDDAALLIRRDEEAHARRRVRGGEALHRVGDRAYRGHARRALLDEPDGAEVIAADRIHFGGAELIVREPKQEELPDPLLFGHPREDASRALDGRGRSGRWSRGHTRGRRGRGRGTRHDCLRACRKNEREDEESAVQ